MSAHLSRLRLFQRHLRSLVWVWVWVWDWIHWHTSPRMRSPSSRHPPFTHYPFSPRSPVCVCDGQTSPHEPRLVVSHSTCSPLSSSPRSLSFVLGTAVINNNNVWSNTHTAGSGGRRAPFSTDIASYTHTARSLACGAPILPRHFQVRWCARLPRPRVLLPHTCTQDGLFLQPQR
jgi:hypothetical protein